MNSGSFDESHQISLTFPLTSLTACMLFLNQSSPPTNFQDKMGPGTSKTGRYGIFWFNRPGFMLSRIEDITVSKSQKVTVDACLFWSGTIIMYCLCLRDIFKAPDMFPANRLDEDKLQKPNKFTAPMLHGHSLRVTLIRDLMIHSHLAHACHSQSWYLLLIVQTVLLSVITRTILPFPAISTSFSCQLRSTLIACPPPSPPPLEWTCENPVDWGESERIDVEVGWELCDMPLYLRIKWKRICQSALKPGLQKAYENGVKWRGDGKESWGHGKKEVLRNAYKYFMRTSRHSGPPSDS